MKKTIVLLSILSLSAVAQEGPQSKQNVSDYKPGFFVRASLTTWRTLGLVNSAIVGNTIPYELMTRERHPYANEYKGGSYMFKTTEEAVAHFKNQQENK